MLATYLVACKGGRYLVGGALARYLSLITGLILFAFAATHFLNHAVGLFDLAAMDRMQAWRLWITRSQPGTIVLAAALVTHIIFGLVKFVRRRTLRLPMWELAQLFLGLGIPFLLLPHIIDTHVANLRFGVQDNYLYELARLWPARALTQSILLAAVWAHGCLGIHYWLKFRPWYGAVQPLLLLVAIAIPLAALSGFVVSGRAVATLLADQSVAERMRELTHWPNSVNDAALAAYSRAASIGFAAVLALAVIAIIVRRLAGLAAPKIAIAYVGGPRVQTAIGPTLLEISRASGVAHASACGGRARCGTCRVRIAEGGATLPQPTLAERFTLARVKAPEDARLACQVRPTAPLAVIRLVQATEADDDLGAANHVSGTGDTAGALRPLCLLYLRMRDLDLIAQDRLAYDLIFILNEFFAAAGAAIDQNSGWVDKFFGDGLLAVFGQERGLERGTEDALRAAAAMDVALDRLNEQLSAEIGRRIRVSIGIHSGSFVMGRIGLGKTSMLSIVGPGTDLARQLAGLAETRGWQIALSADTGKRIGIFDLEERDSMVLPSKSGEPTSIEAIGIARGRDIRLAESTEPSSAAAN